MQMGAWDDRWWGSETWISNVFIVTVHLHVLTYAVRTGDAWEAALASTGSADTSGPAAWNAKSLTGQTALPIILHRNLGCGPSTLIRSSPVSIRAPNVEALRIRSPLLVFHSWVFLAPRIKVTRGTPRCLRHTGFNKTPAHNHVPSCDRPGIQDR